MRKAPYATADQAMRKRHTPPREGNTIIHPLSGNVNSKFTWNALKINSDVGNQAIAEAHRPMFDSDGYLLPPNTLPLKRPINVE